MRNQVLIGDCRELLKTLPENSVHVCVTSPPYFGLRSYGIGTENGEIGLEASPQEYVDKLVAVFREVWRVLHPTGCVFLNLGDTFAANLGYQIPDNMHCDVGNSMSMRVPNGLKPKDLIGIPWRCAFALQAEGWWLRQDIIWCLSGGTWLYVRTQKGDMPMTVKDLARLDPSTIKLWNGEKWTQLLGMNKSDRRGDELEIVLRSGERISCTPTHKFPTNRGLLSADEIVVGDVLHSCQLPEPETPRDCVIDEDAAWFAGLYLAEGSRSGGNNCIQIAGHSKETERWDRVQAIARKFGGSAAVTIVGNKMDIRVYGKVLSAIIDEFVSGRVAHDKGFSPVVWRYSNSFIAAMVDGYLSGDGSKDGDRWRLGFCRNYNLERDLRTACARLGYKLTLNMSSVKYGDKQVPTFRGEMRKLSGTHHNQKNRNEVVEVRKARCRQVYDLGVADDPHLFALASGVLTHNSKPNPMPESVTDRCTKSHEYIFLLTKHGKYFFDNEAIKEPGVGRETYFGSNRYSTFSGRNDSGSYNNESCNTRNRRSVWTVVTTPFSGRTKTVRWVRVGPDDACDGMMRTTSEGCPIHGCQGRQYGEHATDGLIRTSCIDGDHAQELDGEHSSNSTHPAEPNPPSMLDSLAPSCLSTANSHNTGKNKTDHDHETSLPCTPCVQTEIGIERKPNELGLFALNPDNDANKICAGDSGENQSRQILDGTDGKYNEQGVSLASYLSSVNDGCTCQFYKKTTEDTSHFAVFPPALIEPCIMAGTSEKGCCAKCGAPWKRIVTIDRKAGRPALDCGDKNEQGVTRTTLGLSVPSEFKQKRVTTTGWQPTCTCNAETVPCIVLDPFFGSGTTGEVAQRLGRDWIGIELNPAYTPLQRQRTQQPSLLLATG